MPCPSMALARKERYVIESRLVRAVCGRHLIGQDQGSGRIIGGVSVALVGNEGGGVFEDPGLAGES